ncbi:MAG: YkgJ family cysteine cluster protein [Thermoprotei archaeon]|nr:MAG: YkgJ family cysteine cluster protein [Thermoprotei archaeon]RLF18460.1 MAG: YkgJ family cysteine cluster protein [Thermoprotei archaeon]
MRGGHKYIPWRLVRSWKCIRCGRCCIVYSVPLTIKEAINLTRKYGNVVIERSGKQILRSKPNSECIFLLWRGGEAFCKIYFERPLVCKLYPLYIRLVPLLEAGPPQLAEYICADGLVLYVYVDALCPGVNRQGFPIEFIVSKTVDIWRGELGL